MRHYYIFKPLGKVLWRLFCVHHLSHGFLLCVSAAPNKGVLNLLLKSLFYPLLFVLNVAEQ